MTPFNYASGIPPEYFCSSCRAKELRLYRQYNVLADCVSLLCLSCAEKHGYVMDSPHTMGWLAGSSNSNRGWSDILGLYFSTRCRCKMVGKFTVRRREMKIWFFVTMLIYFGNFKNAITAVHENEWIYFMECTSFAAFGFFYWVRNWPWG